MKLKNNKLKTRLVDVISAFGFVILIITLFVLAGCDNQSQYCPPDRMVISEIVCSDNGNGATTCDPIIYCISEIR